ncbi:MAG: hypothetical protein Q9162_000681 [Coniocarpon cinnabarinum]
MPQICMLCRLERGFVVLGRAIKHRIKKRRGRASKQARKGKVPQKTSKNSYVPAADRANIKAKAKANTKNQKEYDVYKHGYYTTYRKNIFGKSHYGKDDGHNQAMRTLDHYKRWHRFKRRANPANWFKSNKDDNNKPPPGGGGGGGGEGPEGNEKADPKGDQPSSEKPSSTSDQTSGKSSKWSSRSSSPGAGSDFEKVDKPSSEDKSSSSDNGKGGKSGKWWPWGGKQGGS